MSQTTIEVNTPRGTMPVHVNRPDGDKAAPVVVIYMDAGGIRPVLHEHAERLVRGGYTAVLPDLYYPIDLGDRPNPEKLAAGDPAEFERLGKVMSHVKDHDVIEDTRLLLATLPDRPAEPWGCIGFCMGGRFGLRAAEEFGSELAAAALLHPTGLVTDEPDSPHLDIDHVEAALYLGFGANDRLTPPETIPPLRRQLEQHDVAHRIEVLPEAEHGFTMPGRAAYNRDAAEHVWAGTLELLGERL